MIEPLDGSSLNTPPEPLVLAVAADDAFIVPFAVTLYSALINFRGERAIEIYVMDGGISSENKERIRRMLSRFEVNLTWLRPPVEKLEGLRTFSRFPIATYYRILIPDLLPVQHSKLIFLDSDVVVEGDLEELWNIDPAGAVFLAGQDHVNPTISMGLLNWEELGLPPEGKYCNTGILLIDLERWREEGVAEAVLEYLRMNPAPLRFADQDGLNAVLHFRWREFDPGWNLIPLCFPEAPLRGLSGAAMLTHLKSQPDRPHIIHFAGHRKPWAGRLNHPIRHVFFHYLWESGWFTPGQRLRFLSILALLRVKSHLVDLKRAVRLWRKGRRRTTELGTQKTG